LNCELKLEFRIYYSLFKLWPYKATGSGGNLGFGSGEAEPQQDVPADGKNRRWTSRYAL